MTSEYPFVWLQRPANSCCLVLNITSSIKCYLKLSMIAIYKQHDFFLKYVFFGGFTTIYILKMKDDV